MDDRNKKLIAIIGIALACLAICCVVALLVFVIVDPFGWFGGLFAGGAPIAEVLPPDTDLYFALDLAEMQSSETQDVVRTIISSIPGAEMGDLEAVLSDAVDEILARYGLTFESDIKPWIGRGMGIGLLQFRLDQYGGVSEPDIVFAVLVRDQDGADDFVADYIDARELEAGAAFSSEEYRGATVHTLETGYSTEVVARSDDVLYFGSSSSAVESAIDAQKGESLADEPAFEGMASQFPDGSFATLYVGTNFLTSYSEVMGMYGGGVDFVETGMQSVGMTLAFTGFGMQLDVLVGIDEEALDDSQRELLAGPRPRGDILSMFPEGTLAFFVGQGLDMVWQNLEEAMSTYYGADFGESMLYFEDEFGFRPDLDLFPILDGEWGLLVLPGSGTELEQELGGLGLVLVAESSQEDELDEVVGEAADALEQAGLNIQERSADGGLVYTAESEGVEVLSFGTQDGVLLLGTDADVTIETMQRTSSLDDSRAFRDVTEAFPRGIAPVFYVDLNSMLPILMENGSMDWADLVEELGIDPRPFTHLAAGSGEWENGIMRATLVIMMDLE